MARKLRLQSVTLSHCSANVILATVVSRNPRSAEAGAVGKPTARPRPAAVNVFLIAALSSDAPTASSTALPDARNV
jgi:hypothetical protein